METNNIRNKITKRLTIVLSSIFSVLTLVLTLAINHSAILDYFLTRWMKQEQNEHLEILERGKEIFKLKLEEFDRVNNTASLVLQPQIPLSNKVYILSNYQEKLWDDFDLVEGYNFVLTKEEDILAYSKSVWETCTMIDLSEKDVSKSELLVDSTVYMCTLGLGKFVWVVFPLGVIEDKQKFLNKMVIYSKLIEEEVRKGIKSL